MRNALLVLSKVCGVLNLSHSQMLTLFCIFQLLPYYPKVLKLSNSLEKKIIALREAASAKSRMEIASLALFELLGPSLECV